MGRVLSILVRADAFALIAWAALVAIGLAAVYSCTVDFQSSAEIVPSNLSRAVFHTQVTWAVVGAIVALLCLLIPYRHFDTLAYVAYGVALVLLVAVLVVGMESGGGRRWLSLGGMSFQPSEIAKVALILALGRFLAGRRDRSAKVLVGGAVAFVLPLFLLVVREPDLGTALVYPALAVPMLFWAGVPARLLLALISPVLSAVIMFTGQHTLDDVWPWVLYVIALMGLLYFARLYIVQNLLLMGSNLVTGLAIPLVWEKLHPYQQARILAFFSPSDADRLGYGYQTFQSKVAIGSGGLAGKGYLEGSQKGLAFLPERHTDFIFSVIGEELGLLGALVVLALFLLLVVRALRVAEISKRSFGGMIAVGVASYFCFQALVNIAITVGLLPVTGLPLPLLSKGGSSMLASCIMLGLLLNVSARWSEV
ncbi:MAG TPA: rod shape-determining protein RodA [Candidatus Krumholzibacteria bacterium]|nr:rod shape-determining protein RodA [Candidatus Krumholzibacteria bacterium]